MNETTSRAVKAGVLQRAGKILTSLPVRLLVSVGLLGIVAAMIEWNALTAGLANAAWGWFVLSVPLFCFAFAIGAFRWRALLSHASLVVSWWSTLRATLIGLFTNNVLPTGYGGDAVRAWIMGGSGKPLARSATSVLVDRASGFVCLLLLAWSAVLLKAGSIPAEVVLLLAIATALVGLAGSAALVVVRREGLGRFVPDPVRPWAGEVAAVLRTYEKDRALLARILVLGVAYQAVVVTAFWLIAESLHLNLDPAVLAVVVPTVLMAALLPISIAGFGVREGAFVVLLGKFGVAAADATLLSLLSVSAVAIASSPGGIAIAYDPRRVERRASAVGT